MPFIITAVDDFKTSFSLPAGWSCQLTRKNVLTCSFAQQSLKVQKAAREKFHNRNINITF